MYDLNHLIKKTAVEPRGYQIRIVQKALNGFINKNMRSILIESACGSGKTIMALLTARMLADHANAKIGWVAMRKHLLKQAEEENHTSGINAPLTYISMFEKKVPVGLDTLIVDEAQHDVTSNMVRIHSSIKPRFILGLSATPLRQDRVKLCFDHSIRDAGIARLIEEGFLSRYHHYTIPHWTVEGVTTRYLAEPARWGKSVMYFHKLEQCHEAQRALVSGGITAEVVHGSSDTERQLEDFTEGRLQVLVNCMKLTEGFNAEDLQTVWCRPSCKSVTIQMAGRVLRKHPKVPIKQVVQCEKTVYPFQKTALANLQYLWSVDDQTWRTLEVNEQIDEVQKRALHAIAKIDVEMPEMIVNKMAKGKKGSGWQRSGEADGASGIERERTRRDPAAVAKILGNNH